MTDMTNKAMTLERAKEIVDRMCESESVPPSPNPMCDAVCKLVDADDCYALRDWFKEHLSAQRDTHDALVSENSDLRAQCEYLQRRLDEQATGRKGEAVASIQVPRNGLPRQAHFIAHPAWLLLPPGIHNLYTAPPHPRAVTDEMVLRACKNYYGPWWKEELNGDDFQRMRATLEAALSEGKP